MNNKLRTKQIKMQCGFGYDLAHKILYDGEKSETPLPEPGRGNFLGRNLKPKPKKPRGRFY